MAFRAGWNWLKVAWETQQVIVVSVVLGVSGPLIVFFSPWTAKSVEEFENWPNKYIVPATETEPEKKIDMIIMYHEDDIK